jgi:uncharacterized protein with HEPN domain
MNRATRARLLDALRACVAISDFVQGRTFEEYEGSLLLRSAVERQFEIIGEALRRAEIADGSVVTRVTHLRQIVGLRNRLIHGYDVVDQQLVWSIVRDELPTLAEQLTTALADRDVQDGASRLPALAPSRRRGRPCGDA